VGYYESVVAQLSTQTADGKPLRRVGAISGGERRDWFFSIPFAHLLHLPHLFLFKNGQHYLREVPGQSPTTLAQQNVLHISDIVNTGASYERQWLPTLNNLQVHTPFTFAAVVRGNHGREVLAQRGLQLLSPLDLDQDFFQESQQQGLISQFAQRDISLYIESPLEWTRHLLQTTGTQLLTHLRQFSEVEKQRVAAFVTEDPLLLGDEFPEFFTHVRDVLGSLVL
jgi:orotate phosphoribosyltransferase